MHNGVGSAEQQQPLQRAKASSDERTHMLCIYVLRLYNDKGCTHSQHSTEQRVCVWDNVHLFLAREYAVFTIRRRRSRGVGNLSINCGVRLDIVTRIHLDSNSETSNWNYRGKQFGLK